MNASLSAQQRRARAGISLVILFLLTACVGDQVSQRQPGQQLVCHKGYTKAVSSGDFILHLDHGDTVGPCPEK